MLMKKISLFFASFLLLSCIRNNDRDIIEVSGIIEATEVFIKSKVASQVIELRKDEGEKVEQSDTLLILDFESFRYQLQQAESAEKFARLQLDLMQKGARTEDILQAEENYHQAEESFKIAKVNYERALELKSANSFSQKQFEDAELQMKIAKSRLRQAEENLKKIKNLFRTEEILQAEANLQKAIATTNLAKKNFSDCFVVAPSSGTILKKFVEIGEFVGFGSPLFKLGKLDTVEMVVYIPEVELGKIRLGQNVEITNDSYPQKKYSGEVVFISNQAEFTPKNVQTKDERVTLVFAVKIRIPNLSGELKPGMPADAKFVLKNN